MYSYESARRNPQQFQISQDIDSALRLIRQDGLSLREYSPKANEILGATNSADFTKRPPISIGDHDPTERPPAYTPNNASPGIGDFAGAAIPIAAAAATGGLSGPAAFGLSHGLSSILNFATATSRNQLEREKFERSLDGPTDSGFQYQREQRSSPYTTGRTIGRLGYMQRR